MTGLDTARTVGLARWWWTLVVRGVVAIVLGLLAIVSPAFGIALLVGAFAAWAILDGIASLVAGFRTRGRDRSWWLEIVEGLVSVAAGILALLLGWTAGQILVLIFGGWAIVTGVIEIALAVRLRRVIEDEVWLGLAGVASIAFGVVVILFPTAGALGVAWLIGFSGVVFGAFLVGLGWRLRRIDVLARAAGKTA
jgi:uncharacterized membrane protein HdeD (DUF308 family)